MLLSGITSLLPTVFITTVTLKIRVTSGYEKAELCRLVCLYSATYCIDQTIKLQLNRGLKCEWYFATKYLTILSINKFNSMTNHSMSET